MPGRVGAPYDRGQVIERGIVDVVDAQNGVERAAFALMRELDPFNVVGRSPGFIRNRNNAVGWNVENGLGWGSMKREISQGQAIRSIFLDAARDPLAGRHANVSTSG